MIFRNLLISGLRQTRWGDFFDAVSTLVDDFKAQKLVRLKNKFNIVLTDIDNLKDLIISRGFPLISLNGYSSSQQYLQRRNECLTQERLYRSGQTSYDYIFKSFWLKDGVFPLRVSSLTNVFVVVRDPIESLSSVTSTNFISDQESPVIQYYLPGGIPVPNPPITSTLPVLLSDSANLAEGQRILFMDTNEVRDYTNHFVVEYEFLVTEDVDLFQSPYTAQALYQTIENSKRLKEVVHFQPRIQVPFSSITGNVNQVSYVSYDRLFTSNEKTIWISGDLSLVNKLQIGNGRNYQIGTTPITQCNLPIETYYPLTAYFNNIEQKPTRLFTEYLSYEYSKLGIAATGAVSGQQEILNFSEVALFQDNSIIAYAYFPTVNLAPEMYSSVSFDFIIS